MYHKLLLLLFLSTCVPALNVLYAQDDGEKTEEKEDKKKNKNAYKDLLEDAKRQDGLFGVIEKEGRHTLSCRWRCSRRRYSS